MEKSLNPYQSLKKAFRQFCEQVGIRRRMAVWVYSKKTLEDNDARLLRGLSEHVTAVNQAGYDVVLKTSDAGLEVWYQEESPDIPFIDE